MSAELIISKNILLSIFPFTLLKLRKLGMTFEKPVVVIDNGSYTIKAGFSCDNHPVSIFRTLVGRPNYLHGTYGREYYDVYIGDEALEKVHDLELSQPIVNGRILDWDNIERIWHHIFYRELKVAPEDRAVILACGPTASMEEKIKCCEIFFDTLNAPALCIQSQSVLAMYGSGVTTGLCVDLGYATTNVIPVFEGGVVSYAQIDTGLGGLQISDYIKKCLGERGDLEGIKTPQDIENIQKNCYITQDCAMLRKDCKRKYKISFENEIDVSNEVFMAAEMLFQPDLVKNEDTGYVPLQDALVTASLKCDDELRLELYDSIIPCGGLALIPGLNERLQIEMENILNQSVTILSSPEPYTVTWLGGATLAGLADTEKMFIMKKQYEEHGERIIRNKFM